MASISAKSKLNDEVVTVTVDVDLGSDLGDAIDKFGEGVVFDNFCRNAIITAQGAVRREIRTGKTPEQIQARMNDWKPGVKLARVATDPIQAFKAKLANMSEEERMAALTELGLV